MTASSRIHRIPPRVGSGRTRCTIQNHWNGDCGVGPNMIGFRSYLFEHVEIVLMPGLPHALEGADVPTRNVRHAHAEHSLKTIGTHQHRVPSMSCTPVMAHEDRAGDIQHIEQTN